MLRAAGAPPRDGGFLERLQANAEKLVRIRPVDEEPRGDDRAAMLARVEQRAAQGNIAGALAELAKLPAEARAPVAGLDRQGRSAQQGARRQPASRRRRASRRSKAAP